MSPPDAVLATGENALITAGIDIDLINGFEIETGTEFDAYIDDCNTTMMITQDGETEAIISNDKDWEQINSLLKKDNATVHIYDATSTLVKTFDGTESNLNSKEIRNFLSIQKQGIYTIDVHSEGLSISRKYLQLKL